MGSMSDCFDNAMAESFFASLGCELLDRRRFRTQAEARMAVFSYIEGRYNPRRRPSSLGSVSPSYFGAEHWAQAAWKALATAGFAGHPTQYLPVQ